MAAKREEREVSVLVMHHDTPEQRAARTIPTRLLAMLGDRAVTLTRRQYPEVPLTWVHHDTLMRTHTTEPVA